VVRALEVALAGGGRDQPPPERERLDRRLVLGIALDRSVLFERIDARVDAMFAAGFVEEVRSLVARGHGCDAPAFSAIGYREVCGFLRGDLTLDEARARVKTATHRLARTQDGWFRRSDPRITWLEAGTDLTERAAAAVRAFLDAEPEE
jgi:tRNA dimethylallyltransferase